MKNTKKASWTRFATGCYQLTLEDGTFFEARSMAYHSEGLCSEKVWILFCWESAEHTGEDGYCNHFATLADCKEAAQEIEEEKKS